MPQFTHLKPPTDGTPITRRNGQLIVPDELRGRVLSLYMLDRGFMPLGALFAGIAAHFIGAPATVAIMGAMVIVLTGIVAWRIPAIRRLES